MLWKIYSVIITIAVAVLVSNEYGLEISITQPLQVHAAIIDYDETLLKSIVNLYEQQLEENAAENQEVERLQQVVRLKDSEGFVRDHLIELDPSFILVNQHDYEENGQPKTLYLYESRAKEVFYTLPQSTTKKYFRVAQGETINLISSNEKDEEPKQLAYYRCYTNAPACTSEIMYTGLQLE